MNSYNKKEKIVYFILIMTLIIDAVNGFVIYTFKTDYSLIGMLYRSIVICYFTFDYILARKKNFIKSIFIILFLAFNIIIAYYLYSNSLSGVSKNFVESSKVILYLLISVSLINMIKTGKIRRELLKKVIYDSVKIIFFIYIISFLLIGSRSTYGDVGYKAIFYANNALNITLIVLFIFQIEKFLTSKNTKDLFYTLFLIAALILLGSKSSIIFIAFYFLMKVFFQKSSAKKLKNILVFVIIGVVGYYFLNTFFNEEIQQIYYRQIYFMNKFSSSDSIFTYLVSTRNTFLSTAFSDFKSNFTILRLLFGTGAFYNQSIIGASLGIDFKAIEMDLFDILFSYGLIGVIITYGFTLYVLLKNYKLMKYKERYAEIISVLSIIIFSILGGHVFSEAMSSVYLGIVLSLFYSNNKVQSKKL